MGSFGPMEIFLIFLVILLVFGAKRIPEIARGLGKGIKEFKQATRDIAGEFNVEDRGESPRRPSLGNPTPRTNTYSDPSVEDAPVPAQPEADRQERQ